MSDKVLMGKIILQNNLRLWEERERGEELLAEQEESDG
jgi:hypothetical protein